MKRNPMKSVHSWINLPLLNKTLNPIPQQLAEDEARKNFFLLFQKNQRNHLYSTIKTYLKFYIFDIVTFITFIHFLFNNYFQQV